MRNVSLEETTEERKAKVEYLFVEHAFYVSDSTAFLQWNAEAVLTRPSVCAEHIQLHSQLHSSPDDPAASFVLTAQAEQPAVQPAAQLDAANTVPACINIY